MHHPPRRSRTASTATVAGTLFLAEAVSEIAHHQADRFAGVGDYLVEILFGLALTAAALALLSMRTTGGRVRIGAGVGAGGQAAMAVCSVATIIHRSDALGPLFMLGLLASLIGPLLIASSGPRARTIGLTLAVGLIASTAIAHGGTAITGLAWFTVASLLRTPATDPLPVHA